MSLGAGAVQALGEMRDACPLPQFTEIFFHKNVTDVFTPRRPSVFITSLDHRSTWALSIGRAQRMSFMASRSLAPSGQGKSVRFLPDAIHLSGSSSSASDVDVIGIVSTGAA